MQPIRTQRTGNLLSKPRQQPEFAPKERSGEQGYEYFTVEITIPEYIHPGFRLRFTKYYIAGVLTGSRRAPDALKKELT